MNNKKLNIIVASAGCVMLILALVLYMLKVDKIISYILFTVGVIFEFVYKFRMLLEKKNNNQKYYSEIIVLMFYIMMIAAIWLL